MQIPCPTVRNYYLSKVNSVSAAVGVCVCHACINTANTETKNYKICGVIQDYLLSNTLIILLALLEFMCSPCLFIIKMGKLYHLHFYTKRWGVVAVF